MKYYTSTCLCGCDEQIMIKEYHKYQGIPLYINGHNKTKGYYKHGGKGTKLYKIWLNMRRRCRNENNKYYGGKGITVCPEWANDYIIFRDWSLNNGYMD